MTFIKVYDFQTMCVTVSTLFCLLKVLLEEMRTLMEYVHYTLSNFVPILHGNVSENLNYKSDISIFFPLKIQHF